MEQDYISRAEYNRDLTVTQERFAKIDARQDGFAAQQQAQGDEIRQLKTLIVDGFKEVRGDFKDVREDVAALKSLSRRFIEGLAAGAGISYAFYQAIHAALKVMT